MQKSLKILDKISSTSTFPTTLPKFLTATLKSSVALSNSSFKFLFLKSCKERIQLFRSILWRSLVINTSVFVYNDFFKINLISDTTLSMFVSLRTEIEKGLYFFNCSGTLKSYKSVLLTNKIELLSN